MEPRLKVLTAIALLTTTPLAAIRASQVATANRRESAARPAHRVAILEGEVHDGQAFERSIGNDLKIWLEPIASGWVLRIVPVREAKANHDYAELATPPYRSVSPLLVSTDFGFRAQDALAWNPRHFRFAFDRASFDALLAEYDRCQSLTRGGSAAVKDVRLAESRLAMSVSHMPEGYLQILDAGLVQGAADQTKAASLVASHPNASGRNVDQSFNGATTPLGRLNWFRFRICMDLPPGFQVDKTLKIRYLNEF